MDLLEFIMGLGSEKYNFIYNRIRYLIEVKSGATCVISYNYAKIKVDSLIYVNISCYNSH